MSDFRQDIKGGKIQEIAITDKGFFIHQKFFKNSENMKTYKVREEEFYS